MEKNIHTKIAEIIHTTKKVNIHEHFRLPNLTGDWANLTTILPRAYIGFFDFYPGLKNPVFPIEKLEIPSDPKDFIPFYQGLQNPAKHAINQGLKDVYGIDLDALSPQDISQIPVLNRKIQDTYSDPSKIAKLLSNESITHTLFEVNEAWFPPTSEYAHFSSVLQPQITPHKLLRINSLLYGFDPACWNPNTQLLVNYNKFKHNTTRYPRNFNKFLENMDELLDYAKNEAIGLKCASAYERTISFGSKTIVSEGSEKSKIAYMLHHKLHNILPSDVIQFGNFVFHYILQYVEHHWAKDDPTKKVPIQIHTGTAIPSGSHPGNLEPLFSSYPNITFELLHFGYPWCDAVIPLLKNYPNTISDLVWLPQLEPSRIDHILSLIHQHNLWDKLIAYGGDCNCVEGSIGALHVLNERLTEFFTSLVEKGKMHIDEVATVIEKIYYSNPCTYWHLGK